MLEVADTTCGVDVGKRPYWMGVDQYDPTPCVLPKGHDGEHDCPSSCPCKRTGE